ncbi:MAG: hypothetical protein V7K35_01345 [Nostoc sp.]
MEASGSKASGRVGGLFGVALLDFRHSTSLIPRTAIAILWQCIYQMDRP